MTLRAVRLDRELLGERVVVRVKNVFWLSPPEVILVTVPLIMEMVE